jgi:PKHD-type hydroxylase
MSIYQFAPSPSYNLTTSFASWQDGFTDEEIDKIIAIGESRRIKEAYVGTDKNKKANEKIRKSKISWIDNAEDSIWLYDKLAYYCRKLNGEFFNFDLYGFSENMQYTIYNGDEEGHYDSHIDMFPAGADSAQRKLSMVVQLTDPEKYEGGDLQIYCSSGCESVKKEKGFIAVFPSYLLHKVTPVTTGIRRSLVVWVCGPPFK